MNQAKLIKPLLILFAIIVIITIISSVLVLTNSQNGTKTQQQQLIIGIFPRRDIPTTITMFTPLAKHIEAKTGIPTKVETTKTFLSFWKNVQNKKYDIVHYNQLHYVLSHEKQGYKVITRNREFNSDTLRSSIMVRKNSGIENLIELKNKTIFFGGGELAFIAHIANRVALRKQGLKDTEYKWRYVKTPINTVINVFNGKATAAGIGNISKYSKKLKGQINIEQLKSIYLSSEIPHFPWAVKDDMPKALLEKIKNSMTILNNTKKGRSILSAARLNALLPAEDKEYDIVREIYLEYLSGTEE